MDRKSFIFLVIFLVLIFVASVSPIVFTNGFDPIFFVNFTPKTNAVSKPTEAKYISVYIGGAVLYEGWHVMADGSRLFELLDIVKPHQTYNSIYNLMLKLEDGKHYTISYMQNGTVQYPVNVNSTMFRSFARSLGIDDDIINLLLKIRNEIGGEFTSKEQILNAVGENIFNEIYYKLYIGEKV